MTRRLELRLFLLLFFSDLGLALLSLYLATQARIRLEFGAEATPEALQPPLALYLIVAVIWGAVLPVTGVYDPNRTRRLVREVQALIPAIAAAVLLLAGVLYFSFRDVSRLQVVYFAVLDMGLTLGLRVALRLLFRVRGSSRRMRRVLVVGAGKVGREVADRVGDHAWAGLQVVGYVDDDAAKQGRVLGGAPVLGRLADTARLVEEIEVHEVVFALPLRAHRRLVELVTELQRVPVKVRVVPDLVDLAFFRTTAEDLGGVPVIGLRDPAIEGFGRVVKRGFDLVVGTLLLLVSLPAMAIIAVAIRLDSPGPAVFKQERVGENLRPFDMYKFRSMVAGAEERKGELLRTTEKGQLVHKHPDDPRVTPVGRVLRRYSLDELPQLLNVLKGEMSLVGPRPEMPWLVDKYEPWQRKRFAVPQGITGWWQINGRGDRAMHLHTEDDLWYIQNWSPWLDLKIIWRTIGAVISRRGAF